MAAELGWDEARVERELDDWRAVAAAEGLVVEWRLPRRLRLRPRSASPRRSASRARARGGRVNLRLRERELYLRPGQPLLMGIVNATPGLLLRSPGERDVDELVARAHALVAAGAAMIDVGGESGRTDTAAVPVEEEIDRVVPLVERLAADGLTVSVDTWRAPVARAALDAGAALINDVSGLSDPASPRPAPRRGAGLVITHTRVPPKKKAFPEYDGRGGRRRRAADRARPPRRGERGVAEEQLVLDPGIDLAKTPAESVELLRRLGELDALGRPLLLAISRKDFVGALAGRRAGGAAGGHAGGDRGRRGLAAPRSCACTTWPRRPTSCACVRRCAASSRCPQTCELDVALRREPAA